VLSSRIFVILSLLVLKFKFIDEYFAEFTSRKFMSEDALIPKFIDPVISFAIPETATATNSPSSLTIGPPLLPGFSAASI
jgi:hypothetical protein|tara:strand:- start:1024 stop:1263 length:240 start_codon:yes stop_codon:yes gene_type:complete